MIFDFESIGLSLGLMKGDEIMVINGAIVSDLDMMFIESVLQEELTLCMMLRSSRPGKYTEHYMLLSRNLVKDSVLTNSRDASTGK